MATTARQPKQSRKGAPDSAPRRPAWTGPRASPTFSPGIPNARLPNGPPPASNGGFPPLAQTNGAPRTDRPQDRVLQQLSGLTGTTITLSTKTSQRYEGVIASTNGEGDTTGVTLKDVKELTQPGAPLKDQIFIASTNIDTWASGPADAKAPNGTDSFKTDTDISQKAAARRDRELQAWQPSEDTTQTSQPTFGTTGHADDMTFGPGASHGNNTWDQFAVNEKLFGVTAGFDEEQYTTRLDRSAPDFKEKEKKALALANEILGTAAANVHVAEERVMNFAGDNGTNEEDKYGAVVRGANAYVPPGARKTGPSPANAKDAKLEIPKVSVNAPDGSNVQAPPSVTSPNVAAAGAKPAADPLPAFRDFVSNERDRLLKKKQALMKNEMDKRMAELIKFSKNFKLNKPIPDDLVPILAKDEEKQRQIKEKSSKDAESSHARAIGSLNTLSSSGNHIGPSPTVHRMQPATPSSAKPPAAIPEIAKQQQGPTTPGVSAAKSSVGISKTATGKAAEGSAAAAAGTAAGKNGRINMYIQPIPAFKGKRISTAPTSTGTNANGAAPAPSRSSSSHVAGNNNVPMSPATANRLNVNASSFRPTVKPFSPVGSPSVNGQSSASASPKPKPADASSAQSPSQPQTPNPFFGTRIIKKAPPVHIKDDFNPFKHNKVADASAVGAMWPYSGKRYMQMFPQPQPQPQQQSPPMAPPGPPPPIPPPSYEEDSAAQAAARGQYVYAYPPYAYPGQPMMPGMGPPPPGAYMPGPFMQPMPYPHMPPPNTMYPTTPMGQMPPPQAYMPPPGAYPPPPNGAGPRPSMPPTPIPSHTHPYYHQSPQLQHAVPYPMMMPPPPGAHPYETAPPPVPMGGVGHA